MRKLIGILIVAAASMTAATSMAAVSSGTGREPAAVIPAARGHVLLIHGGMGGGSFGGMNPGSAGGMNPGSQGGMNGGMGNNGGMGGNGMIGHTDPAGPGREVECTPSFWSRIFGSTDAGRCAAAQRASARKPVGSTVHRPAKPVVRKTLQLKSADAAPIR